MEHLNYSKGSEARFRAQRFSYHMPVRRSGDMRKDAEKQ